MLNNTRKEMMKLANQLSVWGNLISLLVSVDNIKLLKAALEQLNELIVEVLNIIDKDDIPS